MTFPEFRLFGSRHAHELSARAQAEIAKMQRARWPLFSWCLSVCWTSARGASEARAESHKRPLFLLVDSVCVCVCVFVTGLQAARLGGSRWNLADLVSWWMARRPFFKFPVRFPVFPETGKIDFCGDSAYFGRHFLVNEIRYPKNDRLIFSKYHKLSNEPIFTSIFEKMAEEIDF